MKSHNMIKIVVLFVIFTFIISNLIFNTMKTGNNSNATIALNFERQNLKISKISEEIHIEGNSGWSAAKTAGICTGSGRSMTFSKFSI